MRKTLTAAMVAGALILSCGSALALPTINWFTTGGAQLFQDDGFTAITGSKLDPTVGGFLQLIYVGTAYDGFTPSGVGTVGDDVVVGTSWVGEGTAMVADGQFKAADSHSYPIGSLFVIRFFTAPSADFDPDVNPATPDSLVPAGGFYGVSGTFATTVAGDLDSEDFSIGAPLRASLAVPEPGTTALFMLGMGTLGLLRRKRS